MKIKELSKNEAILYYENNLKNGNIDGIIPTDDDYIKLKVRLKESFEQILDSFGVIPENLSSFSKAYVFDVQLGCVLYNVFSNEFNIPLCHLSNDNFWRYIQVELVPFITIYRWGIENTNRLYSQSNRLYLKILWYYYYLSYTGDLYNTRTLLSHKCNSTDTIVQLCERSGRDHSYKVDLTRCIMKCKVKNELYSDEFRKLMVLNSAYLKTMDPYLYYSNLEEYVEMLINKV